MSVLTEVKVENVIEMVVLYLSLSLSLSQWYASPDYNLFGPYVEHRRAHPDQLFYILHPSYVWRLWNLIQGNTQENIQPNPPSSGFIGERAHIRSGCMQTLRLYFWSGYYTDSFCVQHSVCYAYVPMLEAMHISKR